MTLLAKLAADVVGLSYAPETREAYLDLIAPCPADRVNPRICSALGAMSSCALVVRGLLARANVKHPILLAPYRTGRAVSDVVEIAREADALRDGDHEPVVDDVMVLEGPEHVLTIVGARKDPSAILPTLCSIDGGQRDGGGFEAVLRRERGYDVSARTLGGRKVVYVVEAAVLLARWGVAA